MSATLPKVCHLNIAPGFRGGERQTELLLCELSHRGHRQRLVIRRGNTLAERCADFAGLEVREVAPNPVAAGVAAKGCQIAHAHEGRTVYSALLANLAFAIPYVVTRRVVAPQSASFSRSIAYRRAAQVVAVSRAAGTELRVRNPSVHPMIIPDACAGFDVNQAEVKRLREKYAGKRLIGHIGALEHSHKGQSTLIAAARIAAERHPDWHFLLCGDGNDRARFQREIGGLGNIELLGWVDNVGDYLASFDLFAYPSLHEALGSTLLDAMQFGLPVVASKVGGIPDFVVDGVNGRLIEPEQPAELVGAIEELLDNAELRAAIRRANITRSADFGAQQMADAYAAVYRRIST